MILVTGTKRSGTSMWMQILRAGGVPLFGEAFPLGWGASIREANRRGFYESMLRHGIYWRTNPHPKTGAYFFPEQVLRHGVKVFIPGLVRTDRAYIGRVVATMRHWREYRASLLRMRAMERSSAEQAGTALPEPRRRLDPVLEWWTENFMLVRDIATRRYPVHVTTYDRLLADPRAEIDAVFGWLGVGPLDRDAATRAVDAAQRSASRAAAADDTDDDPTWADHVAVFDALYAAVHEGSGLDGTLLDALNRTHAALLPAIEADRRAARRPGELRFSPAPPVRDGVWMDVDHFDAGDHFDDDE